jgi:hypothetical protein
MEQRLTHSHPESAILNHRLRDRLPSTKASSSRNTIPAVSRTRSVCDGASIG